MTDQERQILELQKKELKMLRAERERLEIAKKLQRERLKLIELNKTDEQRKREAEEAERLKEEERKATEQKAQEALKVLEKERRAETRCIVGQNLLFWGGWALVILLCFA